MIREKYVRNLVDMGAALIAQIVFCYGKLTGQIQISWWWIMIPASVYAVHGIALNALEKRT